MHRNSSGFAFFTSRPLQHTEHAFVPQCAVCRCQGWPAYGEVIEELDWSVGEIPCTLEQQGLAEDTPVLFTSDNGPWLYMRHHGGSAGLLANGKGTTFEGGMRVPTAWISARPCCRGNRAQETRSAITAAANFRLIAVDPGN